MKTLATCLFLMISLSLTAQTKIEELFGDWKVKSFVANGKTEDASKVYFSFSMTDVGDYILNQVHLVSDRNVVCTAMIMEKEANKFSHDYIMSSAEDKPQYSFWLTGTYTYALNGDVLTITGENKKMVLERK